jgi:hypothetical protein
MRRRSGAVSGVGSLLSLLDKVAAAELRVGPPVFAARGRSSTATAAITASRRWALNLASEKSSGCETLGAALSQGSSEFPRWAVERRSQNTLAMPPARFTWTI